MSYYTITEVAKLFRVSQNTIRRQVMSGEIQAIRCGHSWRVPASELEKMQKNLVVTSDEPK